MKEIDYCRDIFHLASPIQLNLHETVINIDDYFLRPEMVGAVASVDGLDIVTDKTKGTISIKVTGEIPPIMTLDVKVGPQTFNLILLRSKKIIHTYEFDSRGGFINLLQIAGDFNNWNPAGYDFQNHNGIWKKELELEPGNYPYQLIANGNWFNDPDNPDKIDNGYGSFNSLLKIRRRKEGESPEITTEKTFSHGFVISANEPITGFVVLWQNKNISLENLFINNERLLITIPQEAYEIKRTYVRAWAYNEFGLSNDIIIPLEYGKVVNDADQLTRNDKEHQIIYFLLIDRFYNGNPENDAPVSEPGLQAKLNFYGGDIAGITRKLKDGYFSKIGINSIWISPIFQNPKKAYESEGQKSSGYHGYWPINNRKVDERFGTKDELKTMIELAHKQNINVLLDFVANHVHEENEIIKENEDWSTPLHLEDGSLNIGRWEDHRLTTWFDTFLPTLDYEKPEVVDYMTDIALYWISEFDFDGFRHDATKHIPDVFWRSLTRKLKQQIMCKQSKRLYQIGETFGGRDLLKSYVNSGMIDGQFSFNLYYEVRAAFCKDNENFNKLGTALKQDLQAFGYNHMMGNITGNHDLPRFISYAGEDLYFDQNAKHEGWIRHITVKNPIGYKKLSCMTAFICTIPGVPVIYYGDEIGIAGGADPDNRRPMRFERLNNFEASTLSTAAKIINIRKNSLSLTYGNFIFLKKTGMTMAYCRKFFSCACIMVFNKSSNTEKIVVELPDEYEGLRFYNNFDSVFTINVRTLEITLPNHSFEILTTKAI